MEGYRMLTDGRYRLPSLLYGLGIERFGEFLFEAQFSFSNEPIFHIHTWFAAPCQIKFIRSLFNLFFCWSNIGLGHLIPSPC